MARASGVNGIAKIAKIAEIAGVDPSMPDPRERQELWREYEVNRHSATRAWWLTALSVLGGAVAYGILQHVGLIK